MRIAAKLNETENQFKRETRYTVFKRADSLCALNQEERRTLNALAEKVAKYRSDIGKRPFTCVVVESDWPEYEPTWQAIEERMTKEGATK